MDSPHLLGISGALRHGSCNRRLIHESARLFGPCRFTEADLNLPLYHGDEEEAHGLPGAVQTLCDQIAEADAVIISTPEYNKGLSGVLKNALDWISRGKGNPWDDKPVAVMPAAAGRAGGERGQAMLRQCMVAFRPRILQGPEMHLHDCQNQVDADGRLISEQYEKTLKALMDRLRVEIGR